MKKKKVFITFITFIKKINCQTDIELLLTFNYLYEI